MAETYGIENLGFLTLTFPDHVTCAREAQRRLNSLTTNILKIRYRQYLGVFERQHSSRIHYHYLVALDQDIRTGFIHEEVDNGIYTSASKYLRNEWKEWRENIAPGYGFGRCQLYPIQSTSDAISKYVGKYISKHVAVRKDEDKGVRLVRYSQGARKILQATGDYSRNPDGSIKKGASVGNTRFSFYSPGSQKWRSNLAKFAMYIELRTLNPIHDISDFAKYLGPNWAYINREAILNIDKVLEEFHNREETR